MGDRGRRRWAWGFFAVAATYLLAVYFLPDFVESSDGRPQSQRSSSVNCTRYLRVPVQHGERNGQPWSIFASIHNNHGCRAWLLSMEFRPEGVSRGSWKGSWAVSAGGHLPNSATISARDEATVEGRVVSGVVGWRVRTVVFRTRSGREVAVHPKVPDAKLRKRFVWLQNLRYFLRFYPAGDPVKVAKLLDYHGDTIATVRARLGELQGDMGIG